MRLNRYRQEAELNAAKLAHRLGVHRSLIYKWESGECMPTRKTMLKIVRLSKGMVRPLDFYPECKRALRRLGV